MKHPVIVMPFFVVKDGSLVRYKYISRLRQERERRGWSRNYVAEQVKVDVITVGRWERGERLPHPLYRQELCTLFVMNAEDLGLFLEPQLDEAMVISEIPPEVPNTLNEVAETSSEPSVPAVTTLIADPVLPMPVIEEKTKTSVFQQRRTLLVGLGGLATITLMGAGLQLLLHTSPSSATLPPVLLNKPSQQLIDASSTPWINHLSWSPDSRTIAAATGINVINFWDIEKGALIRDYTTLNAFVNDISWSKTDAVASANADRYSGSIQVWHYPLGTPAVTFQRPYALRTVSWSPNGTYLAFAGHAPIVEVWDPSIPRMVSHYTYPALGSLGINRVKWSATGNLLACATDDGTVHVWEALTGTLKTIYREHQSKVFDLAWSPAGQYIASASLDKTTRVWDALTGQTLQVYRGQTNYVEAVDWSLQGNYIVSGGLDHTVQVWEAFTGKLVVGYQGFTGTVEAVLWSMDGKTIVVGTNTQGIEIWSVPQ